MLVTVYTVQNKSLKIAGKTSTPKNEINKTLENQRTDLRSGLWFSFVLGAKYKSYSRISHFKNLAKPYIGFFMGVKFSVEAFVIEICNFANASTRI